MGWLLKLMRWRITPGGFGRALPAEGSHRDTDIYIHRDLVQQYAVTHVRLDRLRTVDSLAGAFSRARKANR